MNTSLDCMPCFMKMALREARLACPDDEAMQRRIVVAWGRKLDDLDLTQPPPAIARHLNDLVREISGCGDLYLEDKKEANAWVLGLLPELESMVEEERCKVDGDPLALVLELAIVGNYIDRGIDLDVDVKAELAKVSGVVSSSTFDVFKEAVRPESKVLVLGDNTGEIVLDKLLVRELQLIGCEVTYAVRAKPIINDSTMEDARDVGMDVLCKVVTSGVDTPGTVIERCTEEFLERMRSADVIISKGQGNFESLEGVWPGIFCAFKVKCRRVADDAGLPLGSSAFCLTNPPDDSKGKFESGNGVSL